MQPKRCSACPDDECLLAVMSRNSLSAAELHFSNRQQCSRSTNLYILQPTDFVSVWASLLQELRRFKKPNNVQPLRQRLYSTIAAVDGYLPVYCRTHLYSTDWS